ncbi:uncharacterized protein TNCV_3653071 [Trichonephila clavipes]|nr:uncharacterized protein TNCV_3653071 [Trichonephila clavipes]
MAPCVGNERCHSKVSSDNRSDESFSRHVTDGQSSYRRRCCALSATARLRDSATLQWFLYLSETPCKLHAEDAKLGTVWVSQQPVEMPDIQHDVDAELGTAHSPPVQAFAVRLGETLR